MKATKERKKDIHTRISEKSHDLLERYQKMEDVNGQLLFKNMKSNVIEFALELLDNHFNPEKNSKQEIAYKLINELNMLTVGKPTFLSYISGNYKNAFEKNIAVEIIEWYKGKLIEELSLMEILEAIKDTWRAGNYFYKIDIEQKEKGIIQMFMYHDLHNKDFSKFWGDYFEILLKNVKKCEVEKFIRRELLILRIKEP